MSGAGVIIGQVAVKVTPDLKGFRGRALAQLKTIERGLDDLKVDLKVNERGLAGQVRRAVDRATKDSGNRLQIRVDPESERSLNSAIDEVERRLSRLREVEIGNPRTRGQLERTLKDLRDVHYIQIEVDHSSQASVREAIRKIDSELAKKRTVKIDVDTDEDSLRRMREGLAHSISDISNRVLRGIDDYVARVDLDPKLKPEDARRVRREIEQILMRRDALEVDFDLELDPAQKRRIMHDIEDIDDKLDKLRNTRADVEPNMVEAAYRHAQARMAWLARARVVRLLPLVDNKAAAAAAATIAALSGTRGMAHSLQKIWDTFKNLDKNTPLIGGLAAAIAGLAGWLGTAGSNLFTLARGLAHIGPLFLAMPGVLGGFALGVWGMIVALKDFGEIFPDFEKKMDRLREKMSAGFWKNAKGPTRELIDTMFPQLEAGMLKTSDSLGKFFGLLAGATTNEFDGALDGMFKNLRKSIDIAGEGIHETVRAMRILGETGAEYLPRLAKWYNDISESFANWLEKNKENGNLYKWIDRAIENLGHLRKAISEFGGVLAGIGRATERGGGSTLKDLSETLEKVHKVVDGEVFQSGLSRVIQASHRSMTNIANISKDAWYDFWREFPSFVERAMDIMSTTIGTALRGIFTALNNDTFQQGLLDFFSGIQAVVIALEPVLPKVAEAFGLLASAFSELLKAMAPGVATLFEALADALIEIGPHLGTLTEALGGAFVKAIEAIVPHIPKVTDFIIKMIEWMSANPEVVLGIAAAIFTISTVGSALGGVAGTIGGIVSTLGGTGALIALGVVLGLVGAIGSLIAANPDMETFQNRFKGIFEDMEGLNKRVKEQLDAGDWGYALERVLAANGAFWDMMVAVWRLGSASTIAIVEGILDALDHFGLGIADVVTYVAAGFENIFLIIETAALAMKEAAKGNFVEASLIVATGMANLTTIAEIEGDKLARELERSARVSVDGFGEAFDITNPPKLDGASAAIAGKLDGLPGEMGSIADSATAQFNVRLGEIVAGDTLMGAAERIAAPLDDLPPLVGARASASAESLVHGLDNLDAALPPFEALPNRITLALAGIPMLMAVWGATWERSLLVGMDNFKAVIAVLIKLPERIIAPVRGINLHSHGVQIAHGLARGIDSGSSAAEAAARRMANRVVREARAALQIQSPSRVARDEVGHWFGLGVAEGILSSMEGVGGSLMDGLIDSLREGRSEFRRELDNIAGDIEGHEYGGLRFAGVPSNPFGDGTDASQGEAKYHIEVNAETKGASAEEVAEEVLYAARRIDRGGLYARRIG